GDTAKRHSRRGDRERYSLPRERIAAPGGGGIFRRYRSARCRLRRRTQALVLRHRNRHSPFLLPVHPTRARALSPAIAVFGAPVARGAGGVCTAAPRPRSLS